MRGMVPPKIHTFSEASLWILAVVKFWNACPCVDCFLYLPQNTKSPSHHHLPPPPSHTPFDKQHFKPRICLSDSYGEGATYKNPQLSSTVSTKCDEYCSNNEGVFT